MRLVILYSAHPFILYILFRKHHLPTQIVVEDDDGDDVVDDDDDEEDDNKYVPKVLQWPTVPTAVTVQAALYGEAGEANIAAEFTEGEWDKI